MADTNTSESNIKQKIDSSSSEVKDIKFVRSSNAFEVALEYQKQLIHKEYQLEELRNKFDRAKEIGNEEIIEEYEKRLKKSKTANIKAIRRNAFIAGMVLGFLLWYVLAR